jgi:hypothetical protein
MVDVAPRIRARLCGVIQTEGSLAGDGIPLTTGVEDGEGAGGIILLDGDGVGGITLFEGVIDGVGVGGITFVDGDGVGGTVLLDGVTDGVTGGGAIVYVILPRTRVEPH